MIADVPGLIEGANEGHGLGHAFLRHVERTRVLVAVVDGAADDPVAQWRAVAEELRLHDPALMRRPMPMVVTKQDLPEALRAWPAVAKALRADGASRSPSRPTTGPGSMPCAPRWTRRWPWRRPPRRPTRRKRRCGCTASTRSTPGWQVVAETDGFRVRGRRIEASGGADRLQERRVARPLPAHAGADGHRRRAAAAGGGPGTMVRIGRVELEWGEDE